MCCLNQTFFSLRREIPFYLVKWLLFRLMFASGVVKLTSQCPTWWSLTGTFLNRICLILLKY